MALDRFSAQATAYARFRITYPAALYAWLLPLVSGRGRAWDCATGNGQVAVVLADYFAQVEATDLSGQQLAQAPARSNVRYQPATAEQTPFPAAHFDLITVGQAVHWFDLPAYHRELRRVARPGAVLAERGYGLLRTDDADINQVLDHFHDITTGPYWDSNRWHITEEYARLPFPGEAVHTAHFGVPGRWRVADLLGYLRTWSAAGNYARQHEGADVVALVEDELTRRWGPGERAVTTPVFARAGRVA